MRRALTGLVALLIAVGLVLAVQPASDSEASANVKAYCGEEAGGDYTCGKALVVGYHVFLNSLAGSCHANVTVAGAGTATLRISHNVNQCPWPANTARSIVYTVGDPYVGGIVELNTSAAGAPASEAGGSDSARYAYVAIGSVLSAVAVAGSTLYARRRLAAR